MGIVVSTADAPAFIRAIDSIPQNTNWTVKRVCASALFTPPPADVRSATERDDIVERVTEATCLVRVTGPAPESASPANGTPRTRVSRLAPPAR